jgi:tryptophanyl-tRNA synthetase
MNNLAEIDQELFRGAEKAAAIANGVLKRVRQKLGFSF